MQQSPPLHLNPFEQLLLDEVRGAREAAAAANTGVAAVQATLTAERRFCSQCKADLQENDADLFRRVGSLEQWKAAHDGAGAGEAAAEDKKARRMSKVAVIFTALAGAATTVAEWPKIKAVLASIFTMPPTPPGGP